MSISLFVFPFPILLSRRVLRVLRDNLSIFPIVKNSNKKCSKHAEENLENLHRLRSAWSALPGKLTRCYTNPRVINIIYLLSYHSSFPSSPSSSSTSSLVVVFVFIFGISVLLHNLRGWHSSYDFDYWYQRKTCSTLLLPFASLLSALCSSASA